MSMSTFDTVILVMVVTGGILVIGGLYLIGSGALKLTGDKAGKTDLKIGDFFQIATTVPGLGIFLIGLLFEATSLSYADKARGDDLDTRVRAAVESDRTAHAMRLTGLVQTPTDQNINLSICLGQQIVARSNNPFDYTVGPYPDFLVMQIETAGVAPQRWTVAAADRVPPSLRNFSRLISPNNGVVDLGQVQLKQIVNLEPVLAQLPSPSAEAPPVPAGAAYIAPR
jgi:hypothetical protein